jgi:hypothetical protein
LIEAVKAGNSNQKSIVTFVSARTDAGDKKIRDSLKSASSGLNPVLLVEAKGVKNELNYTLLGDTPL